MKIRKILFWLPSILSVSFMCTMIVTLRHQFCIVNEFPNIIASIRADIIAISGVLSGIIIAFLTSKVLQIRQEKISKMPEFKELTQKVHKFRSVVHNLLCSTLWLDGLKYHVDSKYKKLTFYDVQEITFKDSKIIPLASEFVHDTTYGLSGTPFLYLELKSFIFSDHYFDDTVYPEFEIPKYYTTNILEKWNQYHCGEGLARYFHDNYSIFQDDLKLSRVIEYYKEAIMNACISIDKEKFVNREFNSKLISELGNLFTRSILPSVLRLQLSIEEKPPRIVGYLSVIVMSLIVFGIIMPLASIIYRLNVVFDVTSLIMVTTTSFYLMVSFYKFLRDETQVL